MFFEVQLISLRCQCQCLVTNHFQTRSNHILDLHLIFHIFRLELRNPEGGKNKIHTSNSCRNCVSWRLSGAALLARMCTNNEPVYFAIYWEWEKMKLKHKNLRMHSICSTFKNKIRKNINAWRWQVRARSHYLNIWLEFHHCFARQCVYLVSVCVGRSV